MLNLSQSQKSFLRACELIPGGVNSPARAFGAVGGNPIFIKHAEGAYLYDIDGNQYIDYVGSWGPMILGHGHPHVVSALQNAIFQGTSFGAPTLAENALAQMVVDAIPSVEMVRFVNSGTEATMSAIRLARGYTGRDMIVKFEGNYHGHADSLLVAAGSAGATLGVPNSPGVTQGTSKDTLVVPYNNPDALRKTFEQFGSKIAAIIFEPVVGNMGCVVPTLDFRNAIFEMRDRHGTIVICDEVMTGFRVAYSGAQSIFGLSPDLTTLGKIIGGGLPVGAYGGRREIMQHVLPAGKVFQAGTLSGNPLAMAAGIATLQALQSTDPYRYLDRLALQLAGGISQAAQKYGVPLCVNRFGSMMTFFFQGGPVSNWTTAAQSDTVRYANFFWGMAERGVYFPCSQFEALFISSAHSEDDIRRTIHAAEETFATLA
ncbi:MAG: glutamate-1-semialdehyde 2,1-aminomutase [Planctomycetia bacterium]|nr:glutamate-1-semialdehyde 2,1-aminomutase [Planctomycetia bacterium]